MKLTVNKNWYSKALAPASLEWKPGSPREKFTNVILGFLTIQRESKKVGFKNALNQPVIPVSDRMLSVIYKDVQSRKKFRKVVEEYKLAIKDHSWIAHDLADKLGQEPRSNLWHITEADCKGEVIEVEFDCSNFGLFSIYKNAILKADGTKVNETDEFSGKWAIEAYENGELTYADFIEVGKVASNIINGKVKTEEPSCRTFDAVTLCKKTLREKCFINSVTKVGMKEVYDISGAITITAPVGITALGKGHFTDTDALAWAYCQEHGLSKDPYERIFKKVLELDKRDLYQSKRKWNKSARKILKVDLQCVLNCDYQYLLTCKKAYHCEVKLSKGEYFSKVRQWLIWNAIQKTDKALFTAALFCKQNGLKGNFYRVHTLGEKIIMEYIIKSLTKMGITVHRVHDAIWTTDEKLIKAGEANVTKFVGKILKTAFQNKDIRNPRKAISRLASGISKNIIDWVEEGVKVNTTVEKFIERKIA